MFPLFATPDSWCRHAPVVHGVLTAALLALPTTAQAQRERAVLRLESLGGTTIVAPAGTRATDDMTQQVLQLQAAHRLVRDGGKTIVTIGGLFRNVRLALPTPSAMANEDGTVDLVMATAEIGLVRRLNQRHTLVSLVRPGAFGTLADAGQLRVEGAVFVDRVLSARACRTRPVSVVCCRFPSCTS